MARMPIQTEISTTVLEQQIKQMQEDSRALRRRVEAIESAIGKIQGRLTTMTVAIVVIAINAGIDITAIVAGLI